MQWLTIIIWIVNGSYLPFLIYLPVLILYALCISGYYFKRVAYICPECNEVFVTDFKKAFFAKHTPKLSKYLPTLLMDSNSLIYGLKSTDEYTTAIIVTAVLFVFSIIASIPIFNKKHI